MDIRLATAADAADVNSIYRPNIEGSFVSFELTPPANAVMAERIRKAITWLVWEDEDGIGGYAYASRYRDRPAYQWSVETSVYVHPARQRLGVGRALYSELFELLVQQGYYTAFAGITLPNAASVGLHEAMGFEPVGVYRKAGFKLGAWRDVGWWQRALRSYAAPSASPSTAFRHT